MAFDDGYKVVAAAGTAEVLSTNTSICAEVTVVAHLSNTSIVNVGDSGVIAATGATHRGIPLAAGDAVTWHHVAPSALWIDSRVNGEGVTFVWST
jgi:hypothetical protein